MGQTVALTICQWESPGLLFALTNQNMSNLVLLQIAARHEEFLNNSKPPFCKYKQPASLTKRLPESKFSGI